MVDVRTLAAAVLGVALGAVFVLSPETIVQIHTAGRVSRDRYGRYGEDGTSGSVPDAGASESGADDGPTGTDDGSAADSGIPSWWRRLVQGVGVALLVGGAYFGWTLV